MGWQELARSVQRADGMEFGFMLLFAAVACLGGIYLAFRGLKRARIIEDTPTSLIRSAAQGYVELQGRARLMEGEPIIAPLTGTICAWYLYRIEERRRSGSGRNSHTRWVSIDKGVSDELFLIEDQTGSCIVDPEGAEVTPSARSVWYGSTTRPTGGPPAGHSWFGGGRYRYTEWRIAPGDPLYAIGEFQTVGGGGDLPATAAEVRELLREWKRTPQVMQTFDRNRDGQVDAREWEAAQLAARAQVMREQQERAMSPGTDLLRRPQVSGRPYILSVRPQDAMASGYRWLARGGLAAFFTGGAALVWLIQVRTAIL